MNLSYAVGQYKDRHSKQAIQRTRFMTALVMSLSSTCVVSFPTPGEIASDTEVPPWLPIWRMWATTTLAQRPHGRSEGTKTEYVVNERFWHEFSNDP